MKHGFVLVSGDRFLPGRQIALFLVEGRGRQTILIDFEDSTGFL